MTNSGWYRLHEDCIICGTHKNTFTGMDWMIKKKSEKEKKAAKTKKKKVKFTQQCKKIGFKILQSDKACQDCISKCLKGTKK
jgi:hypothetical protein